MPALSLFALVTLSPMASAARTVVHGGDEAAARAQVQAFLPGETLSMVDLGQAVVGKAPAAIGAVELRTCEGEAWAPGTLAQLRRQVQAHLDYGEDDQVAALLDTHLAALACARERVVPADLAWLYLVQGWTLQQRGTEDEARLAWSRARRADPSQAWPATLGSEDPAYGAWLAAVAPMAPRELALSPSPSALEVWVNGVPASGTVTLDGDWNLVQLGEPVRSAWVRAGEGGLASLIIPEATPASAVDWVGEADTRWDLSAVLGLVLEGSSGKALVASEAGIWEGTPGTDAWSRLDTPPAASAAVEPEAPALPPDATDKGGGPKLGLLAGGGVAALGGAVLAGMSYRAGSRLSTSYTVEADYNNAVAAHARWELAYYGGLGLGVAGLAVAATGAILGRNTQVTLVPTPGGAHLTLELRR